MTPDVVSELFDANKIVGSSPNSHSISESEGKYVTVPGVGTITTDELRTKLEEGRPGYPLTGGYRRSRRSRRGQKSRRSQKSRRNQKSRKNRRNVSLRK